MYAWLRPLLFLLDAETAHKLTLKALPYLSRLYKSVPLVPQLKTTLWNRNFPNVLGLAAGFDKNAEVADALFTLGFGFVELGTVTPLPQEGNERPRVFRSPKYHAVINRMGFPNGGAFQFKDNLTKFLGKAPRHQGVLGINIGMNKNQTEAVKDYTLLIRSLGSMADYLTINISSPNTPGLRNLQDPQILTELVIALKEERAKSCGTINPPPILIKLAPDLAEEQINELAETLLKLEIDGVILTNTTLYRPDTLPEAFKNQKGGLSGAPLKDISTGVIRNFYAKTGGKIPIIGVGGIENGDDAYAKIRAGASLIQLYSGLIFHGPQIIRKINKSLVENLAADGFNHISEAVGADHKL